MPLAVFSHARSWLKPIRLEGLTRCDSRSGGRIIAGEIEGSDERTGSVSRISLPSFGRLEENESGMVSGEY